MNDPKRWLDDDTALLPHERKMLLGGLQMGPSPEQEDQAWRLLSTLGTVVPEGEANSSSEGSGAKPTLPHSASTSLSAGLSGSVKVLLVGLIVPIAAVGGYLAVGRETQLSALESASPAARAVAPTEPRSTPEDGLIQAASPSGPAPLQVEERRAQAAKSGVVRTYPATMASSLLANAPSSQPNEGSPFASVQTEAPGLSGASLLREEAMMVDRARAALRRGDTAGATQLLEGAKTRFPNGVLLQEREALAIELLVRSGRREEAETQARRFVQSRPNSPHSQRLRELFSLP